MNTALVVGTRRSKLAIRQGELVIAELQRHIPEFVGSIHTISTEGDRRIHDDLQRIGGKGVFVKEIEREMLDGTIDIAVHSFKDVSAQIPGGLMIGCVPARDSPFDLLVSPHACERIDDLPEHARIGTNSSRRQSQLLHLRPDLQIIPIRGNVTTRLQKIDSEHLDGIVLAEAGLHRLGLGPGILNEQYGCHIMTLQHALVPAAGQGAMAVECRKGDTRVLELLGTIDDKTTNREVMIERSFMLALGGSCTFPIGAYASSSPNSIGFDGLVASTDGRHVFTEHIESISNSPPVADLGILAAHDIIKQGALPFVTPAGTGNPTP